MIFPAKPAKPTAKRDIMGTSANARLRSRGGFHFDRLLERSREIKSSSGKTIIIASKVGNASPEEKKIGLNAYRKK